MTQPTQPTQPTPDDKDWTWVLGAACADCGLDLREVPGPRVATLLAVNAQAWPEVLSRSDARDRPAPDVWSALEYGCHVRDVFRRFDGRLAQLLTEDDPLFVNWDQDATALEDDYRSQDPERVSADLTTAADMLVTRFEGVTLAQWDRPGRRSDGAVFTVDSLARYCLHDPVHHLWDVGGTLKS